MCTTWTCFCFFLFYFKQKTAYEWRISDWSSDVCSSDLIDVQAGERLPEAGQQFAPARRLRGEIQHPSKNNPHPQRRARKPSASPDFGSPPEIGRASCRERVCQYVEISVVAVLLK